MSKPAEIYKDVGFIETYTGTFYMDRPEFVLKDIAHSLSLLCRFNGHSKFFYSVAEHSVLVAELMERVTGGDPWEGLLHDGVEAYLSDVPAPFKQYFPDWRAVEDRLDRALRTAAGLPETKSKECKEADWLAVFIEAQTLKLSQGAHWVDPEGLRTRAKYLHTVGWAVSGWQPCEAEERFLRAVETYSLGRERGTLS